MRLTVGPLPPSVYWRRRAVVLGGVLVIVALIVYSCGGSDPEPTGSQRDGKQKGSSSPITYPSERPSDQPSDPGGNPSAPDGSPGPPAGGGTGPGSGENVPACAEGDLAIRPEPAHTQTPEGARLRINLVITNNSDRACKADIGADRQEVKVLHGDKRIWSSDDCKPAQGSQVEVLSPGVPVEKFWVTWDGRKSAPKCGGDRAVVRAGTYQIVARLDQVSSDPVTIKVVKT